MRAKSADAVAESAGRRPANVSSDNSASVMSNAVPNVQ
jgi:hypothetical protein